MPATSTVFITVAVAGHDLFNRHGSVRSVSHQWTGQDMMAGRTLCRRNWERYLVNERQVIVFEDLPLTNLTKHAKPKQNEQENYLPNGAAAKSGVTKSMLDNGLGTFVAIVTHKAEEAGRQVYKVDPKYTSQLCSGCDKRGET